MMHDFLANNRDELVRRCRAKVAGRPGRSATVEQLENGVPLFLEQLIRVLRAEQSSDPMDGLRISGPAGGGGVPSEIGLAAAQHGRELLILGFSIGEAVHDYGDICQAITDLAHERDAPFSVDEFRTLNRCLDNAIADAVTEFSDQRDFALVDSQEIATRERLASFAHELRNLLQTATLAFTAAKEANLSLTGATGTVLERSLDGLRELIDRSVDEVRLFSMNSIQVRIFPVDDFIAEVGIAASVLAQLNHCTLTIADIDFRLAVKGDRDELCAAVGSLLQNAIKFTQPHTEVMLDAYALSDRILIDVKDHCGGLHPGDIERMFVPFMQRTTDKTDVGLSLSIAKSSVEANDGVLSVRDVPGTGCIFTVSLPRYGMQC
ncbi:HAMP domain-containing sensor histidine kinase (plasmid) [Paraburkholderia sp. PREW-6R]|uniref:sensor histidine kinase n=1 Tax=Paraburkholderia sp. PREW-6R TaxID=3141544 RepID=UPI0031F4A2DB